MPLSRIVFWAVDPLGSKREDLDAHQDDYGQQYVRKWFHDNYYCKNDATIGEGEEKDGDVQARKQGVAPACRF